MIRSTRLQLWMPSRRGVIGQPFALEDDEETLRNLQSSRDRQRRHGVWRRDNGDPIQIRPARETPTANKSAAATATVVKTTQPTASSVIGRRLNRNSRQLIFTADQ